MNWGNKLIVVFLVFAAGMGLMVYRAVTTDFELVEKDYYKQELRYQQVIDGKAEAGKLSKEVELFRTEQGVKLQLPPEMIGQNPEGEILFYCANDAGKDRRAPLKTDSTGQQLVPNEILQAGNYKVKINWSAGGKIYYAEKDILIP
jgi:hypothetical protein